MTVMMIFHHINQDNSEIIYLEIFTHPLQNQHYQAWAVGRVVVQAKTLWVEDQQAELGFELAKADFRRKDWAQHRLKPESAKAGCSLMRSEDPC